jgi:MFS family permease
MAVAYSAFALILFTFGAVIMSLEILSSNLMSPYFGGSVYIWGSIISSFMVHFAVGYVLGGYLAKRSFRVSLFAFLLALSSTWVLFIPQMHTPVCNFIADRVVDVRAGSLVAMNVLFFVPVTIMAMVSPYIIGTLTHHHRDASFTAGLVLFLSTLGSFVGTNLTAFFFIDWFPVSRIIAGLGWTCLAASILVLALRLDRKLQRASRIRI